MGRRSLVVIAGMLLLSCKEKPLKPLDEKQREGMERLVASLDEKTFEPGARSAIAAKSLAEAEGDRLPSTIVRGLGDLSGPSITRGQRSTILWSKLDDELWSKTCKDPKVRAEVSGRNEPPEERTKRVYERCNFSRFDLVTRDEALAADAGALATGMIIYDHLVRHASLVDVEKKLLAIFIRDSAHWPDNPTN